MGNYKKGVIIPFTGKSNNESMEVNTNMTVASGQGLFEESAAREKLNDDFYDEEKAKYRKFITQKNAGGDSIFLNVYNDLKMPMDIIYGASQHIEQHLKNNYEESYDEKTIKSINSVKQNCFRLTKLINKLTDLSKIAAEQYELNYSNMNIVAMVENVVENVVEHVDYIKDKQLVLIFETDVEEKIIMCDPEKIENVILNILSNTVKFSDYGGKIFVNVKSMDCNVEVIVEYEDTDINRNHLISKCDVLGNENKFCDKTVIGNYIEFDLDKSIMELHGGNLCVNYGDGERNEVSISLPCKKIDSIYYLYSKDSTLDNDNLLTKINIEFSDMINTGWN